MHHAKPHSVKREQGIWEFRSRPLLTLTLGESFKIGVFLFHKNESIQRSYTYGSHNL
jgi:hypothetical protein